MMATTRMKIPVGSAPWLIQERRQANELVEMEAEEFSYSVRNEMEWLNEHMSDIFSASNLNVTDIFKTPGKLRGKTPRTARKRNAQGERAPLTDIFAPNAQTSTSPTKTQFYKQVAQIQQQQDENHVEKHPLSAPSPPKQPLLRNKENWDSGYHGITDDEMEVDRLQSPTHGAQSPKKATPQVPVEPERPGSSIGERRTTEETFVSAREDASGTGSKENLRDDDGSTVADEVPEPVEELKPDTAIQPVVDIISATQQTADDSAENMDVDEVRSPSDASSPIKPLLRKSSFTFSSLPSREPLAQKKSIGARSSVLNQARSSFLGRFTGGKSLGGLQQASHAHDDADTMDIDALPKPPLGREDSETTKNHNHSTTQELRNRINMLGQSRDMRTSKSIPNLNASTTQPLYPQLERVQIDKFEGNENARPTTAPAPTSRLEVASSSAAAAEDDEDDWIAPIQSVTQKDALRPDLSRTQTAESVERTNSANDVLLAQPDSPKRKMSPTRPKLPFGHKKAASSSIIESPTKAIMAPSAEHQKAISVSNPNVPSANNSTTPIGSPKRGNFDGAVSATKAKLYSAFRSAKGIFASSAGVSAQAKMEALSPAPKARHAPTEEHVFDNDVAYPSLPQSRVISAESVVSAATASTEGRRTRSSSEKEQKRKDNEAKQIQKMEDELQKIREKERQKAAAHANKLQSPSKETIASQPRAPPSRAESERSKATTEADSGDEMPPPPPPKSMLPTGQPQRLRDPRRIAKPTKEAATKVKPAPVTIRMHVPSQLGHRPVPGPSTAALSQSLHESLPPPPPPKPAITSKASTTSLHSSTSTGNLRTGNPSAAAKKALDAAAKKKEADAKAAQRKADRQREIEQRRQAKQDEERRKLEQERQKQEEERRRVEEERRAEQRRRQAELQKREEAKRAAAERQAAEQKRLEQERLEQQRIEQQRLEQQRLEQQRREQQRAQQEGFAYALKQEKAQNAPQPRADMSGARPISRMMHHDGRPPVQVNPVKPKRALAEEDEQHQRPAIQRNPASYQQHDAKRRKTIDDEEEPTEPRRSVMAGPPVRQSNMGKVNKFPHGYGAAPAPAQHAPSMFIKTVTGQHQIMHGKPNDMSKFANVRPPFADSSQVATASTTNMHKTPGRPISTAHGMKSNPVSAAKSSPHYPNPESIHLPEIATDSEDEDSENEFQAPSWTESPALRQLLTEQQLVDPQSVFGPIAPLRMEEVFRNKERQKKFRERTSSANWSGADRLTEEERQRDREARERLMRDGGWSFIPGQ
ncbi:uncharacterized protein PV09_01786 [Verruconis gallopava]|uniref:Inner centromere protein ARK-binding domain-containing protein n=1 Tax=Verruconis gallopava TaxID=253628 RepID=A0A0D1Z4H9_9PEZI|nr:uncharacterized protein PV09_01786 [Verruconis gallopava]KIW07872.1 hypothetical protein PV09_01786 [Verruconis gallopava]